MLCGRVMVPNPDCFVSDSITYEEIDFSKQILIFMAKFSQRRGKCILNSQATNVFTWAASQDIINPTIRMCFI